MDLRHDTYDSPWKEVLELYFEDFLSFYFPAIHELVDWARPVVNLDNELRQIFPESELGDRTADKLFRVWTLAGDCLEVMIHVEIQAQPESGFAERMFVYNYRIFDRYHRPVVSLAVLCDDNPRFHPKSYTACDLGGCRFRLDFPTFKLLQYNERWNELETSDNPFAIVSMAHLKTQATRSTPDERLRWKVHLIRSLYESGYDKEQIINLFRFIDWIMRLPEELSQKVRQTVYEIETEKDMRYVTTIERFGREEGLQEGRVLGREEGRKQGEVLMLQRVLTQAFGSLPASTLERLQNAEADDLVLWASRVLTAESLDDVFG